MRSSSSDEDEERWGTGGRVERVLIEEVPGGFTQKGGSLEELAT